MPGMAAGTQDDRIAPGRRRALGLLACLAMPRAARADEGVLRSGGIALIRHAIAPGSGDPPGMVLGDCATQRNLDAAGRAQARRIGQAFAAAGIAIGAVLTSRWCRAVETAALAFPDRPARPEPAFDSFFAERGEASARTGAARRLLLGWDGPGTLVVVTHQVNITALTGIFPASGEAVLLAREGDGLVLRGRVQA